MRIIHIVFLSSMIITCQTTKTNKVEHHVEVQDDKDYYPNYQDSTRSIQVYKDFETKFIVYATHFSPKFRFAFETRLKNLLNRSQATFNATQSKTGFFVSIFTPDHKKVELNDQNIWSLEMTLNNKDKFSPIKIQHLASKERWTPFFPYVNPWSKEYFVLFDAASITPHAKNMVKQDVINLSISNSDAKVKLIW